MKISGSYENRSFQKDARQGRISGIRTNDIIKGLWIYTQEGMTDSLPFDFKYQEARYHQGKRRLMQTAMKRFLTLTLTVCPSKKLTVILKNKSIMIAREEVSSPTEASLYQHQIPSLPESISSRIRRYERTAIRTMIMIVIKKIFTPSDLYRNAPASRPIMAARLPALVA